MKTIEPKAAAKESWDKIVDVRLGFTSCQIPNAVTCSNLTENDKDKKILVYCARGISSQETVEQLEGSGFNNVWNLTGGISEWLSSNLPTE